MFDRKKKEKQKVKMYGFKFPQRLFDDLRQFEQKENIQIPSSAYATLICVLKQIHREKTTMGEIQEFSLSQYATELNVGYSTLYVGLKFWLDHGFLYEGKNDAGKTLFVLQNAHRYFSEDELNYFIVPHSLFETNIIAELVRTSNGKTFELMLSLFTQFRHGMATIQGTQEVEELKQVRNMSTLKQKLGKRSKGVREAISLLEPLFHVHFIGLSHRGHQVWIHQVEFSLKPDCVVENSDAFEVNPLISEFSRETEHVLKSLNMRFKPRDLFDIMISLKQEVINVLKYVAKNDGENSSYSLRDSWIQTFFYQCLGRFETKIQDQLKQKETFQFTTSIGAYFRTVFRNNIKLFIEQTIPTDYIRKANMKEFMMTGRVPVLHQLLTK
ncbi:hypothetical protein [Bacillus suaedaesalsae]|uniref:Transcriptional regulator n=1 Tax=Bacillus suaedaesalsae TaxID=2810349 RepID=A0ABS2DKW0_9BACI|nr:hypothetical protein [Bacillus suaedaesalsae]MBM6619134.1 hypothetical protein [Bacillus suaedaesalsae]